ncbi:MAG: glycerate kinase, partial [Candidatus Cloacimonetes bacterium]|nr:glycerate kinase [Candidatus Cloacimonadota bacterium]
VQAEFGILSPYRTAVMEMAAASGLMLIPGERRNPLNTSTRGTGQLIRAALDHNCPEIIIGLGGSATTDGGIGMAEELGVSFLDRSGKPIVTTGAGLLELAGIDVSGLDQRIGNTRIIAACDVNNPLHGINGAARVFAAQKGASFDEVELLERGLINFARIVEHDLNQKIDQLPGGGAAGGLGAGLAVFLRAELQAGFKLIDRMTGFSEKALSCDLIITGEGQFDRQSFSGKVVGQVLTIGRKNNIRTVIFTGRNRLEQQIIENVKIIEITPGDYKTEKAITQAGILLEKAARDFALGLRN